MKDENTTPHVPSKSETVLGAPKTALKIIVINMIAVSLLLGVIYLLNGGDLRILPTLSFTILGLALLQLAIQFMLWKLYWWILGLLWGCFTFLLIAFVIGVVTGVLSINSFRLPPYF